jgi:hypothetical protein
MATQNFRETAVGRKWRPIYTPGTQFIKCTNYRTSRKCMRMNVKTQGLKIVCCERVAHSFKVACIALKINGLAGPIFRSCVRCSAGYR